MNSKKQVIASIVSNITDKAKSLKESRRDVVSQADSLDESKDISEDLAIWLQFTIQNVGNEADHTYGIRYDKESGQFKMGLHEVTFRGNDILINGEVYPGSDDLFNLVFARNPKKTEYSDKELSLFHRMLVQTKSYLNPKNGMIKGSKGFKYKNIVRPLINKVPATAYSNSEFSRDVIPVHNNTRVILNGEKRSKCKRRYDNKRRKYETGKHIPLREGGKLTKLLGTEEDQSKSLDVNSNLSEDESEEMNVDQEYTETDVNSNLSEGESEDMTLDQEHTDTDVNSNLSEGESEEMNVDQEHTEMGSSENEGKEKYFESDESTDHEEMSDYVDTGRRAVCEELLHLGLCHVDLDTWNDPNMLVDRLKLLIVSKDAGIEGVKAEAYRILFALQKAGYIENYETFQL